MDTVIIVWSLYAAVAIVLALACALLWVTERRDAASLMLCTLGLATGASAYLELGMMHALTPVEFGEWLRWYHPAGFSALVALALFVRFYLGTGKLWLLVPFIFARLVVMVVNFSVQPNVNFSRIDSLRQVSVLGQQVSTVGSSVTGHWQWFATASLILLLVFLVEAAVAQWRKAGEDSKRKALAVGLGMTIPMLINAAYTQLLVYNILHGAITNILWFFGVMLVMAYELGRDVALNRRTRLEMVELRSQLAHAERVSQMGQLASALAHELSQPLSASAANLEVARAYIGTEKPSRKELNAILDDIEKEDRRAAEIINRMRQLFKRREIEMQPLRVEDVIQDVVSLVRVEAASKRVALHLFLQPGIPRVLGDRVHLSQVLLNLVMNSIQAVQSRPPDARRIVIETRGGESNATVEVAVRDSGPGIPDSMANELFRPFFTTKPNGMGMGLALSSTIIDAHGGRLWTDRNSTEHGGAVFRFTLQRVAEPRPARVIVASSNPVPSAV